jgi:hypothetical protein
LQEALAKNPNFPATLINVIACAKYKNKPAELIGRYMERLTQVAPNCGWLKDVSSKDAEFDTLAAQYTCWCMRFLVAGAAMVSFHVLASCWKRKQTDLCIGEKANFPFVSAERT